VTSWDFAGDAGVAIIILLLLYVVALTLLSLRK